MLGTEAQPLGVVWVGNHFFVSGLQELGWNVWYVNPPEGAVWGWEEVTAGVPFTPDLVVVADKSLPPFVVGMEDFPCMTALYVVDTHIHSWFPRYAQGFDLCLVSLRDHLPWFAGYRLEDEALIWSPPYAPPSAIPTARDTKAPSWPVLFVGTVDAAINPERHAFFAALRPLVPGLEVRRGDYRTLYPQGDIVINHAISNDLNFRVFEALGCGSCLVTPRVAHGLTELFTDGRDLFLYDQNDMPGLAALLHRLAADPQTRRRTAASGHAVVAGGHYLQHRAKNFASKVTTLIQTGRAADLVAKRRASAAAIRSAWLKLLYLHHANTAPTLSMQTRYLAASRGA